MTVAKKFTVLNSNEIPRCHKIDRIISVMYFRFGSKNTGENRQRILQCPQRMPQHIDKWPDKWLGK